ncbi:hypothetical protein [Wolbachia endosymbiont (group A) of Cheilosia soror]|uniref:hypothetical protein n=1 Tax=Wolbachia endosymbiont (group A) of Cheilosia soror TaxID=2953995 RepID=UPI0021F9115C|nr:hypothetical protein [Wolbachia endosymbiont (group A) of Cheilosia soror]
MLKYNILMIMKRLDSSVTRWNDMVRCHPAAPFLPSQEPPFFVIPVRDTGI